MGRSRIQAMLLTLLLLGANLIALNWLLAGWTGARVDLTQEGLFSISPATERLLSSLDEDVTIRGYFSSQAHPKLDPLVPEVRDLLEEYRAVSGGRVVLEIIDPGEDEAAEREAAERYGVQSAPFRVFTRNESKIVNAYFALVVRYADQYVRYNFNDLIEVRPTPDGDIDVSLRNLEYDLTRAIKKVVYGFRSTNELFERIERPVTLTAVWSPDDLPELFAEVPEIVRSAAAELETAGGDVFSFEEIDPTGDEAAQRAVFDRFGTQPMSLGLLDSSRFYLDAVLDVGGRMERIPLIGETVTTASIREMIEASLRRHTPGFLKTIGVVSPDEEQIPPELRMQLQLPPQAPPQFDEVQRFLEQDYALQRVGLDSVDGVPAEVDVLLVIKPRELGERELYNLDQYLMRGGRVVLCAGRYDVDFQQSIRVTPFDTGLGDWLAHHGVTIAETLVLDDRNQPLPIPEIRQTPFGAFRTWRLEPYPYLVQVQDEGFLNPQITSSLGAVGIFWGSPLQIDESVTGELELVPILQSSARSWTDDSTFGVAAEGYVVPDETEPSLLAVALAGRFTSYWSDREPPSFAREPDDPDTAESPAQPPPTIPIESSPETRLVVVANAEFLSDFVARALAQVDGGFFLENLTFLQNLVDWTSLDNEMLEIRTRGTVSRRIDRLDDATIVTLKVMGYVIPVLLLAAIAGWLHWRRANRPTLAPGGAGGAS